MAHNMLYGVMSYLFVVAVCVTAISVLFQRSEKVSKSSLGKSANHAKSILCGSFDFDIDSGTSKNVHENVELCRASFRREEIEKTKTS